MSKRRKTSGTEITDTPTPRDPDTPDLFDGQLFTTQETADRLRLSVPTLERKRGQGDSGLPFIKLGSGKRAKVAYRGEDIEAFIRARRFSSTSDYGNKK